jgi:hypothetical protein
MVRRVQKTIRQHSMLDFNEEAVVVDKGDFRSAVLIDHLRKLSGRGPLKVSVVTQIGNGAKQVFEPLSADFFAARFLEVLASTGDFSGIAPVADVDGTRRLRPLFYIEDKDLLAYAKLRKLGFKTPEEKVDFDVFISSVNEKRPGARLSILRLAEHLQKGKRGSKKGKRTSDLVQF